MTRKTEIGRTLYRIAYDAAMFCLAAYFMVQSWMDYGWLGVLGIIVVAVALFTFVTFWLSITVVAKNRMKGEDSG